MLSTPAAPVICTQGRIDSLVSWLWNGSLFMPIKSRHRPWWTFQCLGEPGDTSLSVFYQTVHPRILPGLYLDSVLRMEIHKLSRPKVFNSDSSFSYTRLNNSLIRPCISIHMGWGGRYPWTFQCISVDHKSRGSKFWTESMYFQKQIQKKKKTSFQCHGFLRFLLSRRVEYSYKCRAYSLERSWIGKCWNGRQVPESKKAG